MGDIGLEQAPLAPPKTPISEIERTPQDTVDVEKTPSNPDLVELIDRWPDLPEHVKVAVMALIKANGQG